MEPIRVIWAGEREAHLLPSDGQSDRLYRTLATSRLDEIEEVIPGSRTVQVRLRRGADPDGVMASVRAVLRDRDDVPASNAVRTVVIPVCYDAHLAPDLEWIARRAGLSEDEAAELHASGDYTVRFLGFAPGFAYIDGLPELLHVPRLDSPRARVAAGSVGITGARTGIYPHASPGGWRLIGMTPLRLFDPMRDQPSMLGPGDRVRFQRITRREFDALRAEPA
ncbi:MAG: 5-oxoprolinase subunit PxpB [Salinibacterium sp.]|nr:5-oxoprolinase subunit PxpB [Salinibacterium sp.]